MIRQILEDPIVANHVNNVRSYHNNLQDVSSIPIKMLHFDSDEKTIISNELTETFRSVYGHLESNPLVKRIKDMMTLASDDVSQLDLKCNSFTCYFTTNDPSFGKARFFGHFHNGPTESSFHRAIDVIPCNVVTYVCPLLICEDRVTERLSCSSISDIYNQLEFIPKFGDWEAMVRFYEMGDSRHVQNFNRIEFGFSDKQITKLEFDACKFFHSVEGFSRNIFLIIVFNKATTDKYVMPSLKISHL
jgi:hypothetical protein